MSDFCYDCGAEDVELYSMAWMQGEQRCAICTLSSFTNGAGDLTPWRFIIEGEPGALVSTHVVAMGGVTTFHLERLSEHDAEVLNAAIAEYKKSKE